MKRIHRHVSIWLAVLVFVIAQAALARRPLAGKSTDPADERGATRLIGEEPATKNQPASNLPRAESPAIEAIEAQPPDTRRPPRHIPNRAELAEPASKIEPANKTDRPNDVSGSVQDVLLRPTRLPFAAETTLADVAEYLRKTYRIRVVVDAAALKRTKAKLVDKVQLELDGVRLKTGLKLLLDQVGLTYRVVAEDNLLIITDSTGADDRIGRIWTELKALHRDVHDLQNAVDDLRELQGLIDGDGQLRKPTIIEEAPDDLKDKPAAVDPKSRPGI